VLIDENGFLMTMFVREISKVSSQLKTTTGLVEESSKASEEAT
jgi:hypothetical protein